jgi:hypothetical protein
MPDRFCAVLAGKIFPPVLVRMGSLQYLGHHILHFPTVPQEISLKEKKSLLMRKLFVVCIAVFILLACRKDKVPPHPFAGNYWCKVSAYSWSLNGPSSSTYAEYMIEVLRENDTIDVLGARIHEDEVVEGQQYFFGQSYKYISFRFSNDSLYISRFSGGMGGGTNTSYVGTRVF